MMAKLRAGNRYDVIFPDAIVRAEADRGEPAAEDRPRPAEERRQRLGLLQRPRYDTGAAHTTPYGMYATGIDLARREGQRDDWVVARPFRRGRPRARSSCSTTSRSASAWRTSGNGFDLSTDGRGRARQVQADADRPEAPAARLLDRRHPNMINGNAWIHHVWNGDVVNIRNQVKNPEDYRFQKAKEGIPVGTDTFAIPANAKHPGTALLFMEFMLDPENASQNIAYFGYPMACDRCRRRPFEDRQGRSGDQHDGRGPAERPAVRVPDRQGQDRSGIGPGPRSRLGAERAALRDDTPPARRAVAAADCSRCRSASCSPLSFGSTDDLGNTIYGWHPENYKRRLRPAIPAGAIALGGLRACNDGALPADRVPGCLLHRRLRGPLEAHADRASGAAVFRELPRADLRLGGDARPTRGS